MDDSTDMHEVIGFWDFFWGGETRGMQTSNETTKNLSEGGADREGCKGWWKGI